MSTSSQYLSKEKSHKDSVKSSVNGCWACTCIGHLWNCLGSLSLPSKFVIPTSYYVLACKATVDGVAGTANNPLVEAFSQNLGLGLALAECAENSNDLSWPWRKIPGPSFPCTDQKWSINKPFLLMLFFLGWKTKLPRIWEHVTGWVPCPSLFNAFPRPKYQECCSVQMKPSKSSLFFIRLNIHLLSISNQSPCWEDRISMRSLDMEDSFKKMLLRRKNKKKHTNNKRTTHLCRHILLQRHQLPFPEIHVIRTWHCLTLQVWQPTFERTLYHITDGAFKSLITHPQILPDLLDACREVAEGQSSILRSCKRSAEPFPDIKSLWEVVKYSLFIFFCPLPDIVKWQRQKESYWMKYRPLISLQKCFQKREHQTLYLIACTYP